MARAEPGMEHAAEGLGEILVTFVKLIVGGTLGLSLVAFLLALAVGAIWRAFSKRKPSWWWFLTLGFVLALGTAVACVMAIVAGLSGKPW